MSKLKPQKCLSPTKENMSPTKISSKGCENLSQFLALVKAAGLKIPANIEKALTENNNGSLLKMKPTQNTKQNEETKKLKVKLGDAQFQLKKLQEDFAQFKLLSKQQKDKEVRKWQDSYNKLKETLEQNSQDSSLKLLKLRQTSQKQICQLKEKQKAELKQQKQKLTNSYQQKLSSQKRLKERQLTQLKQNHENDMKNIKEKYQGQIQQNKVAHQFDMRKQALKFKQSIQAKEKNFESIFTALQSQKKTEEKLHDKTKIQASQAKERLYSELYYERNLKKDLQENVQRLQKQIKSLKSTINDMQVSLHLQKQKAAKRQKTLLSDFQVQKIGAQQLNKEQTAKILSQHEKQLQRYEKKLEQIDEWKKNRESLFQESQQEIQAKFNQRPSRKQDLQMIDKLRSKILRRQDQIRVLNKELKTCALQIENKEETYNKIFTSNTVNKIQKKMLTRDRDEFKSRDSLCRKSQTTDIKFLLKVYNKHI